MISVCIATHNGGKYLRQQIESVISQLDSNDEIVVSDDGSNDDTVDVIKSFQDDRIKMYQFIPPKGLPSYRYATLNFENALKHSKGNYIFLADQDDVWLPEKVNIMMKSLQENPYVLSDCYVTDENLNIISDTRFTPESGITKNKYLAFLKSTPFQGSCAGFRREVLQKALPFPDGIQSHDRWIGFVAAFYFSIKIIPDRLIYYRRHTGTISTTIEGKSQESIFGRLSNRFDYIKGLFSIRNR